MDSDDSRVAWTSLELLDRFRAGDDGAASALFERYFARLTLLARARLSARLASRADAEDVALSAYRSFFAAARAGRFALTRGGDLWRLLAAIAKHKLLRQARHHAAECRSIDRERPLDGAGARETPPCDGQPTAEEVVALADELEWVFATLSPFARRVLELRLRGEELAAIAAETGRSERTVRRTLGDVRDLIARRLDDA